MTAPATPAAALPAIAATATTPTRPSSSATATATSAIGALRPRRSRGRCKRCRHLRRDWGDRRLRSGFVDFGLEHHPFHTAEKPALFEQNTVRELPPPNAEVLRGRIQRVVKISSFETLR